MAEPALGPAASLVRRHDPVLFHSALAAPEPGRGRLMTLYAFDIELSRALSRTSEPMISRMRLQFWREVVEDARAGGVPRAHEVAGPLHALVRERPLPAGLLEGLIEAREAEVEGIGGEAEWDGWAAARFGGLTRLAVACLEAGAADEPATVAAAVSAGQALAAAFAMRTAVPMAAGEGRTLMPGLPEGAVAALARGETDREARLATHALAATGLDGLAEARAGRRSVPRAARAAFLPLGAAEPVLRRAMRADVELAEIVAPGPARIAFGILWRGVSGRW